MFEVMCNIKICLTTTKCIPKLLIKETKYKLKFFSLKHDMNESLTTPEFKDKHKITMWEGCLAMSTR